MRCMTKALSMHGLGLYIYAGEDLPQAEAPESDEDRALREEWEKRQPVLDELALYMIDAHENGKDLDAIRLWYAADTWSAENHKQSAEKEYLWGLLKAHSKLRSAIKANKPEA